MAKEKKGRRVKCYATGEYGFEKFTDPDIPTVALEKIVQILS